MSLKLNANIIKLFLLYLHVNRGITIRIEIKKFKKNLRKRQSSININLYNFFGTLRIIKFEYKILYKLSKFYIIKSYLVAYINLYNATI